jgi:hypothetical protein
MWRLRPIEKLSLASQLRPEYGLCCDGTLFAHATSPPGEVARLHALAQVEKAKALRAVAVSAEPATATVRARLARRRAAESWQAIADPEHGQAEARAYPQLVAFDRYLDTFPQYARKRLHGRRHVARSMPRTALFWRARST